MKFMLTFTYNKGQPPPGFEPTTFDLGNALKIVAKSRNLAEFTSGSTKFRKFAYQIRMFAYCSREFTLTVPLKAKKLLETKPFLLATDLWSMCHLEKVHFISYV